MRKCELIVTNCSQVLTMDTGDPVPRRGAAMENIGIVENGAVAVSETGIVMVGPRAEVESAYESARVLDAAGGVVAPGFVDPHTHPVFAATREEEFEMRCRGVPYEEIARRGGGILSSVRALRRTSKADLERMVLPRLDSFVRHGTTTIEAKSGYGLSFEDEIKSLEVIESLSRSHPIGIVPTFLGGHEIPPEYRQDRGAYVRLLVEKMIPEVARRGLARYCDVFCERNVFTVEESREILLAAKAAGLQPRIHADEFSALGASELAGEIGAATADHLVAVRESGMDAMLSGGVIPVLLPATSFFINLPNDAPARRMIEKGLPVALSSDFNPGSSMTESMQMVMTMACVRLHMTPAECFTAATVNSACAVGMGNRVGMLAPGFQADIAVFKVPNYRMIPYHFGVNHVAAVVKAGRVVHEARPAEIGPK